MNSTEYLFRSELWLLITILFYFLMNGAGIFETCVLVPKWTVAPPLSFQIFRGEYQINLKRFWILMHAIHEVSFILTIVFCWQLLSIRNCLLVLFAIHFAVRVWTIVYFAKNIMEFQKIAETNSQEVSSGLLLRTIRWKNLNYVRTGIYILISIVMVIVYFQIHNGELMN